MEDQPHSLVSSLCFIGKLDKTRNANKVDFYFHSNFINMFIYGELIITLSYKFLLFHSFFLQTLIFSYSCGKLAWNIDQL